MSTGERLDLGVVEAPDPEWADRVATFLFHEPPDFDYHIRVSLAGPLDGLETLQRRHRTRPGVESRMLVLESGGVVGWCHVAPGPAVFAGAWLLDLHMLPGFESKLGRLV